MVAAVTRVSLDSAGHYWLRTQDSVVILTADSALAQRFCTAPGQPHGRRSSSRPPLSSMSPSTVVEESA